MTESLDKLVRSRTYHRGCATRLCSSLDVDHTNTSQYDRNASIESLKSIQIILNDLSEKILQRCIDDGLTDTELEEKMKGDEIYQGKILLCMEKLKGPSGNSSSNASVSVAAAPVDRNINKLPNTPLPTFFLNNLCDSYSEMFILFQICRW